MGKPRTTTEPREGWRWDVSQAVDRDKASPGW